MKNFILTTLLIVLAIVSFTATTYAMYFTFGPVIGTIYLMCAIFEIIYKLFFKK
jgi:uncharacterized membrane protein YdjX (TVP38/TMEM64 family)